MGGGYHRAKLDQEAEIQRGPVPWTIVRASQFHTLVARIFASSARLGLLPAPDAPLQPIDPAEVGRALADTAVEEPSYAITQIAGPEVLSIPELAYRWRAATGSHAVPVPRARPAFGQGRRADEPRRVARPGDLRRLAGDMTALAERFEELRPRLLRIAYGQLGSLAEAEDVLQEAWLRLERVEADELRDLEGWLITVVSRLALDALRSARVRREAYVGPWLPEPIVREPGPEERAAQAEDVSLALLVVLESLSPTERTAFVMHDVFGYAFEEVATTLGVSVAAARQHASRARRAVEARRPRFPATRRQQRELVVAFAAAARDGDMDALLAVLHPDVVLTSDGGGVVIAARKPLVGAERVARAVKPLSAGVEAQVVDVNGMPGLIAESDGVTTVMSVTVDDGQITAVHIQRNPEKLRRGVKPLAAGTVARSPGSSAKRAG